MNDEPADLGNAEWDDSLPKDNWHNFSATGRLAVLMAGATFFALFFPTMGTQWGLPIATLTAYTVLVFALAFRDKNCSLRRPQVRGQLPKFVFMHAPFLLLIYWIEAEWLNLASQIPGWLNTRGSRGSLYEYILIASLFLIAWGQVKWMRTIVKRSLDTEQR